MNASDVLEQSHSLLTAAVDDLPESQWDVAGVCGEWSVKDTVAHLASYERLLLDVLHTFQGNEVSPYIQNFLANGETFNRTIVESRKYETAQNVLNEYQEAQVQTTSLLAQIPSEKVQQVGAMPWFDPERCLGDLINIICAHTKEHCDQIIAFRQHSEGQQGSTGS